MSEVRRGVALRVGVMALALAMFSAVRPAQAQESQQYTVKAGDTLYRIALNHGVSLESLRQINGITGSDIRVGQVLMIPGSNDAGPNAPQAADAADTIRGIVPPPPKSLIRDSVVVPVHSDAKAPPAAASNSADSASVSYVTATARQSLYDIAFEMGVDVDTLLALNPDLPVFLDGVKVAVPAADAASETSYRVRPGDTILRIARDHATSAEALRKQNRLTSDLIEIGQVLVVPSGRSRAQPLGNDPPLISKGHVRPYPSRFAGRLMASGKTYDPDRYYVSHVDLPFGSIVLLSTERDGSEVFAEVSDRLPSTADYAMDVSLVVALALDVGGKSNPEVEIRVVQFGPPE